MLRVLNHFYGDDDRVCIFCNPEFAGRKQRFVRVRDLKTDRWQRFLRAANAQGSSIYLSVYAYTREERTEAAVVEAVDRVFLDFDKPGTYQDFRQDYMPTLTINTSPGKYQVLMSLDRTIPKVYAKSIAKALAHRYGGDHTFDLARVYRAAGFRNLKYSDKPLATISEFNPSVAFDPNTLPCGMEEDETLSPPAGQSGRQTTATITQQLASLRSMSTPRYTIAYQHFLDNAPRKDNGEPDYSHADFQYCIYLFGLGIDAVYVADRLLSDSPDLHRRKGGGLDNYLDKTLERAEAYARHNHIDYATYLKRR